MPISITSLYKRLFGANGPIPGNVIDMAEHGRAGGDGDSQGFKYTGAIPESLREATDSGDANVTYIGLAKLGAVTTEAVWQIRKIDETSGTAITFANGSDNYDSKWSDRESLSYS